MKSAVGLTIYFGALAMILWDGAPRLMSDLWHTRDDYVPAQGRTITAYECTNWNAVLFNQCTVTFVSQPSGERRTITDWRFGRAPSDAVHLLQRRDDPSAVTTDVSLRTVWNRASLVFTVVLFGVFLAFASATKSPKNEDAPVGAPGDERSGEPSGEPNSEPSREPSREAIREPRPVGRPTFGKRHA
jgi:hypothetical protein